MGLSPNISTTTPRTEREIRAGIRRLKLRLDDLASFDPGVISQRNDPRIDALEAAIGESIDETFGASSSAALRYAAARNLDTAPINLYAPIPMPRIVEGLELGKATAIAHITQAIRGLEEKLIDVDSVEQPSGGVVIAGPQAVGGTAPRGIGTSTGALNARPLNLNSGALGDFALNATVEVRGSVESRFVELQARVAFLESLLDIPKPSVEIGLGHNQGPQFEDAEAEIRDLVILLREQPPSSPTIDRDLLLKTAEEASTKARGVFQYFEEFAKGVAKGAGEEIGKRLIQAPWWVAIYYQLQAVSQALVGWLSVLPPPS